MEETTPKVNLVNLKLFSCNMYLCIIMFIVCIASTILVFTKTYVCPKGSYMLKNKNLCTENPITFDATINEHNKDIYKIVFIVSTTIFSVCTIIYYVLIRKIENSGQYNEMMRRING